MWTKVRNFGRPNPLKLRYTEEHETPLITAELHCEQLACGIRLGFFCSQATSKVNLFGVPQVSDSKSRLAKCNFSKQMYLKPEIDEEKSVSIISLFLFRKIRAISNFRVSLKSANLNYTNTQVSYQCFESKNHETTSFYQCFESTNQETTCLIH